MATNFRRPPRHSPQLQSYIDRLRSQYRAGLSTPREITPQVPPEPAAPADEPGAFEEAMAQIGHVMSIPGIPFRELASDQYQKHMLAQSGWTPETGTPPPQFPELTSGEMAKAAAFDVGRPPATHPEAFARGATEMIGDIATDPVAMALIGGGMGGLPPGLARTAAHYGLMGMLGHGIVEGGKETYEEYKRQGAWTPEVTEKVARPVLDAALLLSPYAWRKLRGTRAEEAPPPPGEPGEPLRGLPEGRVPPQLPPWAEGVKRRPSQTLDFDFVPPGDSPAPRPSGARAAYESPAARRMGRWEALAQREAGRGTPEGERWAELMDEYGSRMERGGKWPNPIEELGGEAGVRQLYADGKISQQEATSLLDAMSRLRAAEGRMGELAETGDRADASGVLAEAAQAEYWLMKAANRVGNRAHEAVPAKDIAGRAAQEAVIEAINGLEAERTAALQAGDLTAAEALDVRIRGLRERYLQGEGMPVEARPPETFEDALSRLWAEIEGAEIKGDTARAEALRARYELLEQQGRRAEVVPEDVGARPGERGPEGPEQFRMGAETAQEAATRLWNEIAQAEAAGDTILAEQLRARYGELEAGIARGEGPRPAEDVGAPEPPPRAPEPPPAPPAPPEPPRVPPAAPPPAEPPPAARPGERPAGPPVTTLERPAEPTLGPPVEKPGKLPEATQKKLAALLEGAEQRGGPQAREQLETLAAEQAARRKRARTTEDLRERDAAQREYERRWTEAEADAFDIYGVSVPQMRKLRQELEAEPAEVPAVPAAPEPAPEPPEPAPEAVPAAPEPPAVPAAPEPPEPAPSAPTPTGKDVLGQATFDEYGGFKVGEAVSFGRKKEKGTIRQIFEIPAKGKRPARVRAELKVDTPTKKFPTGYVTNRDIGELTKAEVAPEPAPPETQEGFTVGDEVIYGPSRRHGKITGFPSPGLAEVTREVTNYKGHTRRDKSRIPLEQLEGVEAAPAAPPPEPPPGVPTTGTLDLEEAPEAPEPDRPVSYVSGMSRTKDLLTAAAWEAPFGVDVGELSREGVTQLGTAVARWRGQAFVDSGAFSLYRKMRRREVAAVGTPEVVKPMKGVEPLRFESVFDRYAAILAAAAAEAGNYERDWHPAIKMVMPDVVGDQDASVEALGKYAGRVHDFILNSYTEPVIPIQKGKRSLLEQLVDSINALPPGVSVDHFTIGLPGNAKAVTVEEVKEFTRGMVKEFGIRDQPIKIHFLGVGPGRRLDELTAAVRGEHPKAVISADANRVRSLLRGEITRDEAMAGALGLPDDAELTPQDKLIAGAGPIGDTPDSILELPEDQRDDYIAAIDEILDDFPGITSPRELVEEAMENALGMELAEAAWHLRRRAAQEAPPVPEPEAEPEPEPEDKYPDQGPELNDWLSGDQRKSLAAALGRIPESAHGEVVAGMLRQAKGQKRIRQLVSAIDGTKNIPPKRRSTQERKAYTQNRAELASLKLVLESGFEHLQGVLKDFPDGPKVARRLRQISEGKAIRREKRDDSLTPLATAVADQVGREFNEDFLGPEDFREKIAGYAREVSVDEATVLSEIELDLEAWEEADPKELKQKFLDAEGFGAKRITDILTQGPDHPDFPKVIEYRMRLAREMDAIHEFLLSDPEGSARFLGSGAHERYRQELVPIADALAADLIEQPEPQGQAPFLTGDREGEYPDGTETHLLKTFMWGIKQPGTDRSITTQEAVDALRTQAGRVFGRIAVAYEKARELEKDIEDDVPFDIEDDPGADDVMEAAGIWEQSMRDRPNKGRYGPAPRRPTKKQTDLFGKAFGPVPPIRSAADEARARADAKRQLPPRPGPPAGEREGRPGVRGEGGPGARRPAEVAEPPRPRRGVFGVVLARAEETAVKPPNFELIPPEHREILGEHQHVAVAKAIEQMEKREGFLLADGTGVGKTHTIFSVAHHFAKKGHPVLIIAPTKTISPRKVEGRWVPTGSYADAAAQLRVRYQFAPSAMRDFPLNPANIYVTTYHRLKDLKVTDQTVVIFDEAHKLKNLEKSNVAPEGKKLGDTAHSVMFATATPGDTADQFLWAERVGILEGKTAAEQMHDLGMIVTEKTVYDDKGRARKKFYWRPLSEGKTNRRIQELFERLTAKGAVLKREIDMSALSVEVREVPLPEEGHMVMRLIEEKFPGGGLKAAVKLGHQRRQQEPYKLEETQRIIREELAQDRNVVVFAARINKSDVKKKIYGPDGEVVDEELVWTSEGTIKQLRAWLADQGIPYSEIHGEADETSDVAIERFQGNEAKVVVATVEKGGEGINLDDRTGERARTMVIMTAPFSSVEMFQAAGRIHRYTTVSPSKIIMLRSDNKVDKWNFDINASKMAQLGARVSGQVELLRPDLLYEFGGEEGMVEGLPKAEFSTADIEASLMTITNWRPSRDIISVRQRNFFVKRLAALHPKWNEDGELFTINSLEGDVYYGYFREGSFEIAKERPGTWGKVGFKKVPAMVQRATQKSLGLEAQIEPSPEKEAERLLPGAKKPTIRDKNGQALIDGFAEATFGTPIITEGNLPGDLFSAEQEAIRKRAVTGEQAELPPEQKGLFGQKATARATTHPLLKKLAGEKPSLWPMPTIRETLITGYDWIRHLRSGGEGPFKTEAEVVQAMRALLEQAGLRGRRFRTNATDEEVLAAAEDAYVEAGKKRSPVMVSRAGEPRSGGHDSTDAEIDAAFDDLFARGPATEKVTAVELPGAEWLRPALAGRGKPALDYRMGGGARVLRSVLVERLHNFERIDWESGDYTARTPADVGAIYQIARNPNIEQASQIIRDAETGRFITVKMISSGIPVAVSHGMGQWRDYAASLRKDIAAAQRMNGGRPVKLMTGHNHPSGNSDPSDDDLDFDQRLRNELGEVYEGGLVINHEEFSTITYEAGKQKLTPYRKSLARITEPDPFLLEGVDATAFYREGKHAFNLINPVPEILAVRTFFRPEVLGDDWPMLVMLDSSRNVRDVMVVPPQLWQDPDLFRGYIKEWGKASGAAYTIAAIDNPTLTDRLLAEDYLGDGTLGDAVNITPAGASSAVLRAMLTEKALDAEGLPFGHRQIPYDIETGTWREREHERKYPMGPPVAGGAAPPRKPPKGRPPVAGDMFNWPKGLGPGPGESGWDRKVRFAEKRQAARARGATAASGVDPTTFWDLFIIGGDRFAKGARSFTKWLGTMKGPGEMLRSIWKGLQAILKSEARTTERQADPGEADIVMGRAERRPRVVRPIPETTPRDIETFLESLIKGEPVDPKSGKPPDLAININTITNQGQVVQHLTRMVRALEGKFGRAKTFRSWKTARALAVKNGYTEADVRRLLKEKGALTDYEIIAARILRQEALIDFGPKWAEFRDLEAKFKAEKDPAKKAGWELAMLEAERDANAAAAKAVGVSMTTVAAGSEAGRALNIHRMIAKELTPEEHFLRRLMRDKMANRKQLEELAKALHDNDMAKVGEIYRKIYKPTMLDKILEFWLNSILSGPPTQAANVTGNTTLQALSVPERGVAAQLEARGVRQAIERFLTGEATPQERIPGEATEMLKAMVKTKFGFTQAVKLSWDATWNPDKYAIGAKGEYRPPAIGGALGKIIRSPGRWMEGADLGAKSSAAQAELFARSWRRANAEMRNAKQKWSKEELQARVDQIRDEVRQYIEIDINRKADPGLVTAEQRRFMAEHRWAADDMRAMDHAADVATFRDQNMQITRYIRLIRGKYPWLTFMIPFINTPERILVQAVRRTPVGLARTIQNIKTGKLKGGEASDRLAQGIIGTAMSAGVYMMAKDGQITGAGPSDPRKRRDWIATGKRPYAVKVGDTWISFARIEPLATTFGFAADLAEAQDEKIAGDIWDKLHYTAINNIANKTYLEGMISTAEAVGDPERYGARLYKRMVGAIVPNMFATAARAIDPVYRRTDSIEDTLLSRVPWFSQTVPARLTGTGELRTRGEDPFSRFMSPFRYAREAGPERNLERMFLETGYSPSAPPKHMTMPGTMGRKVLLTQQERELYAAYARRATGFARTLTANGDWNRLDVYMKAEFLRRVYRFAHDAGRKAMYRSVLARVRAGQFEMKGH